MTTLLLYEDSWGRLRDRLAELPPHRVLLLAADGATRDASGAAVHDAASFDAAWMNLDIWRSGQAERFEELIAGARRLEWLQSAAAGTDLSIVQIALAKGARLSTSHVQAEPIADAVVGRLLSFYQHESERAKAQAERRWQRLPFRTVNGSTWMIVGFGAIGQAVARRVRAFGAKIVGVRRSPGSHEGADVLIPPDALAEHLPRADVVVLCLPSQSDIPPLFDATMLARMKQGSVLINVARGSVLDQQALLHALDRGTIEHAILDVFEIEPLPADDPLWSHPKVSVSAHTTAVGGDILAQGDALFVDNFGRFLRGEPLKWEVAPSSASPDGLTAEPSMN